jgi:hypothetical protein
MKSVASAIGVTNTPGSELRRTEEAHRNLPYRY